MQTSRMLGPFFYAPSARELCRPSDRRLSAKLVTIFADTGLHVVSLTYPYGRILGFLDRTVTEMALLYTN
jgi:hypothetical protein